MPPANKAASSYFEGMHSAFAGMEKLLSAPGSPFMTHSVIAAAMAPYVERLQESLKALEHRSEVQDDFKVSPKSGFPTFKDVLALDIDRRAASDKLALLPDMAELKTEMVDHILRHKTFPTAIKKLLSERSYFERVARGKFFSAHILPTTIRVSVNPKTMRPYYIVTWGTYDGPNNQPLIYMATIEDSSDRICKQLVTPDGRLNPNIKIDLPVDGLLNNEFAAEFDKFAESNCDLAISPLTIAMNLDRTFDFLHPKQLRRFVIGPYYSTDVEGDSDGVRALLERTKSPRREHPWLLTWTMQEVFSKHEKAAKKGLWSFGFDPARDEYHIDVNNLECVQQNVSSFEKHILLPHDTYQSLYATGEAEKFFGGFNAHTISGNTVISGV